MKLAARHPPAVAYVACLPSDASTTQRGSPVCGIAIVDELVALGAFDDATSVGERARPRAATVVVLLSASQDAPMIARPQRR